MSDRVVYTLKNNKFEQNSRNLFKKLLNKNRNLHKKKRFDELCKVNYNKIEFFSRAFNFVLFLTLFYNRVINFIKKTVAVS